MDQTFSEYRQVVRRFRERKKRTAHARMVVAGLTAYFAALSLTISRGAVSQASVMNAPFVKAMTASAPATPVVVASPIPEADVVPQKVALSAKSVPEPWDRNIHALPSRGQYKRFYRVTATAYRPINTRMEGGRWTVTERDGRSSHGVAVDPDIIPLGSRLWIPGYGHAIADDIGGWIKGHRIDIRCQDDESMYNWGRRKVRVYVLEDPDDSPE
jgi:3D (Asp-Asp-Asp) domain-containing protein